MHIIVALYVKHEGHKKQLATGRTFSVSLQPPAPKSKLQPSPPPSRKQKKKRTQQKTPPPPPKPPRQPLGMVLLVQCVRKARGSYGDLAQRAMGSFGSGLVDASVAGLKRPFFFIPLFHLLQALCYFQFTTGSIFCPGDLKQMEALQTCSFRCSVHFRRVFLCSVAPSNPRRLAVFC